MSSRSTLLVWTWRKGRRFPTKGAAQDKLKVWKAWYERQGWKIIGSAEKGYIAYAPDYDPERDNVPAGTMNPKVHSAAVRPDNGSYLTSHEIASRLRS